MTDDDEKRNEGSGIGLRCLLILLLFNAGVGPDGPLEFEGIRTSVLAVSYAACLVLMAVATLRSLGLQWVTRQPVAEPPPNATPAADWHAYATFTDPLFQVPAILCVILCVFDLVVDLVAAPLESEAAMWFLAVIAGLAFAAVGGTIWRASQREEAGSAEAVAKLHEQQDADQPGAHALRDPWFAVPTVAAAFLAVVRPTLKDIEEGQPWALFSSVAIGVLVAVVALIAFSAVRERRKRARASAAVDERSVGVTGEDGGAS